MVAALWSDRTARRLLSWEVLAYRILILAGVIFSLPLTARHLGSKRIWHVGYTGAYLLAAVTLAGILFAWWARFHLGRLWSSGVTRKETHRVVDTGPYGRTSSDLHWASDLRSRDGDLAGNCNRGRGLDTDRSGALGEGARRGMFPRGRTRTGGLRAVPASCADAAAVPVARTARLTPENEIERPL
jgi:hypothetical protein